MKKVMYRGRSLTVPEWVGFITTDEDGKIVGWEFIPERSTWANPGFWKLKQGQWIELTNPTDGWRDSLKEVG
jgi:hypothetical protein